MKNIIISTIILFCNVNLSLAQKPNNAPPKNANPDANLNVLKPQGNARIIGYVIDSLQNKPVDFANVTLLNVTNKKVVDGTVCDINGKFSLKNIKEGEYEINITFLGYKNFKQKIGVTSKQNLDLGIIKLTSANNSLDEVVVQGTKKLIEEKVDRTIYNAEIDQSNKGGDAADVLRKVPMLTVDLEGNVSLRGNSNVKVLINNKPSTIMASSVADALKQIPADMIKNVEVITSPSAKYDAEGSSGIINIVTKKNTLKGFTLAKDISFGLRGSNLSLNGSLRTKNMGFSLGGFGRASYNTNGEFENQQFNKLATNPDTSFQNASTRNNRLMGSYQLGYDWDISKNDVLTFGAKYGVRNQHVFQDKLLTRFVKFPSKNTLRDVEITDNSGSIDINLDYAHTFKKPQQTLNISTQYSRNDRKNNFSSTLFVGDSVRTFGNQNPSLNQEFSTQLDFQNPIKENQQFEIGVKNIYRNVTSEYQLPSKGNFEYIQNIIGTYFTYNYLLKSKWNIKLGGRYEFTSIDGENKNIDNSGKSTSSTLQVPSYGVFVPSVNLSKTLKNGSTIKASFSQRIQRPSIQFLNPNEDRSNPLSVSYGNPELRPEYSNNYELSMNNRFKQTYIFSSLFYRNTRASIESFREITKNDKNESIIKTTFQNIGTQDVIGANLFGNIAILKSIQISGGLDMFYSFLTNNQDSIFKAENQGFTLSGRIFASYNFTEKWGLQAFGYFKGQQVQLQGNQGGFSLYSLSIKRDFNNKKGSIGFGAENFFNFNGFTARNKIESPTISQKSSNTFYNTNFKVNFSYRIGKMTFSENRKKTKSINNDDQKDGGSGGDNMGGSSSGGTSNSSGASQGSSNRPSKPASNTEKKP
ncbi:MAG: TonB-dependent receptor [Pseudarcicella sp.]|nr:TonB-dependent receptor [Pseudarcicella sp.]